MSKIQDPISRRAIEIQVNEYGQTPKQLFKNPHPKRFSNKISDFFISEENPKIINLTLKPEEEEELGIATSERGLEKIDITDKMNKKKNINISESKNIQEENEEMANTGTIGKEINFNFDRHYSQLPRFHKR